MDIVYKTYEPEKGFEKAQAEIYNQAVKKYNGQPVTAEQIAQRIKNHNPPQDINGMFFAFTKDKPLSYIQYRFYENDELFIGHAWAVDGCPPDVQKELYNRMYAYIKKKYPTRKEIHLGYIYDHYTEVVSFVKSQGFKPYNSITFYLLDLEKLAKNEPDKKFTFREANQNDLDLLVSLSLNSDLKTMGEKGLQTYFKDRVLKDGNCIILFEEEKAVASTAVINGYYEGKESLARYTAIREGYSEAQKSLMINLAKYLLKKGLKLPIRGTVDDRKKKDGEFIIKNGKVKDKETAYKKTI